MCYVKLCEEEEEGKKKIGDELTHQTSVLPYKLKAKRR